MNLCGRLRLNLSAHREFHAAAHGRCGRAKGSQAYQQYSEEQGVACYMLVWYEMM
jgi:hypothetical protein